MLVAGDPIARGVPEHDVAAVLARGCPRPPSRRSPRGGFRRRAGRAAGAASPPHPVAAHGSARRLLDQDAEHGVAHLHALHAPAPAGDVDRGVEQVVAAAAAVDRHAEQRAALALQPDGGALPARADHGVARSPERERPRDRGPVQRASPGAGRAQSRGGAASTAAWSGSPAGRSRHACGRAGGGAESAIGAGSRRPCRPRRSAAPRGARAGSARAPGRLD